MELVATLGSLRFRFGGSVAADLAEAVPEASIVIDGQPFAVVEAGRSRYLVLDHRRDPSPGRCRLELWHASAPQEGPQLAGLIALCETHLPPGGPSERRMPPQGASLAHIVLLFNEGDAPIL